MRGRDQKFEGCCNKAGTEKKKGGGVLRSVCVRVGREREKFGGACVKIEGEENNLKDVCARLWTVCFTFISCIIALEHTLRTFISELCEGFSKTVWYNEVRCEI